MLIGVAVYQNYLKQYEMRTLQYFGLIFAVIGLVMDLIQIFRYNIAWGISDMVFLSFSSLVLSTISFAITQLPCLVMFQKITPAHVETTMMAFSASVVNLSRGLIGQLTGAAINKYLVGVTEKNMGNYYVLTLIGFGSVIYELFIIRLIPI